ncbi:18180_t:CDS:2, partial [Racocetra fulgida]
LTVQTSSEIASLNFSTNNARIAALLKPSSNRKVIREAAPHERKLFTLVEELGTTPREELEQPTPLRGPDPVTVDKILRAANDAKEQIEFLAQRHEEITSSIDNQVNMGDEASSSGNQMSKIEEDIWHHEKEILALEMIKKEYIKKVNSLDEELAEQKHLEEEEVKLNHRLGMLVLNEDDDFDDMDDSDDIVVSHELAERMQLLEFKKEILAELDQSDIDLNVSIPVPSQQAIIAAMILQMVRNVGGEIPLADLKDQISRAAREKGWQEREGINALYLL